MGEQELRKYYFGFKGNIFSLYDRISDSRGKGTLRPLAQVDYTQVSAYSSGNFAALLKKAFDRVPKKLLRLESDYEYVEIIEIGSLKTEPAARETYELKMNPSTLRKTLKKLGL